MAARLAPVTPRHVQVGWRGVVTDEQGRLLHGPAKAAGVIVGGAIDDADDLDLDVSLDEETLVVRVRANVDLVLDSCEVELGHRFAWNERILLNGYQSWTDTVERRLFESMRGLRGVPRRIVDAYVLDGGGDYRFVDYPQRPGCMHGFTYATFACRDELVLLGSLGEEDGFTLIQTDTTRQKVVVHCECPARPLKAGEEIAVCRLALVRAEGEGFVDAAYDRWFGLMGVSALPAPKLVGYSSWYRHYGDITMDKLAWDLEGLADTLGGLRDQGLLEGLRPLFQIDDGYAKVGDWLLVDREKFPHGAQDLADLAGRAHGLGLAAGLWVAPFVCERDSRLADEHPDWLLRDDGGQPVTTGCHWSGGLALDVCLPAVRDYVSHVLRTMTQEWGFDLLKCDFLYGACMQGHAGLNRGQLMADAIDLMREAVGPRVALLGCGVPLGSAFGKVEYCRIGCDVGLDWDDAPYMRLLHRERVSTRNSLANTHGRAPLDGRAFGNDPDVFFLRSGVRIAAKRRHKLLRDDARLGSVLLTSDDMAAWTDEDRALYREVLATFGAHADKGDSPLCPD